jgi:arylformamidase
MSVARIEIVDLSVAFSERMPKFPASWFPKFSIAEVRPAASDRSRRFTMVQLFAHNGTHVESSNHVTGDTSTIDRVPLERFGGFPTIVDLRDVADCSEVSLDVVRDRLDAPSVAPGEVLLLMTGYNDRRWGEADFWERSPWLSVGAAEYVASAGPALVGLDFQTESPGDASFAVHRALVGGGAVLCEYLFNLERVDEETLFLALPVKIAGVEAAPVRAVGIRGIGRFS